eukprot:8424016-Lingulodinium_polyedra.AAC.1
MVATLHDPAKLAWAGFDTAFVAVPPTLSPKDTKVLAQDALAEQAFQLALALLYTRATSMSWHTD